MTTVNFKIQTVQGKFAPGTVGGDWAWYLQKDKDADVKTLTADPYVSMELGEGSYSMRAQRIDSNQAVLGPMSEVKFVIDGATPPEFVYVDVVGGITADIVVD